MVGTSSAPPSQMRLNAQFCGIWLAPMWFGINFMMFILGWMLLAMQYYPLLI
ncbi:unnamed protein product [Meloidogyne enterolobii]|uniref:Uncharacterized protein n=1 Tax=Meloidogyne enterolobii TaxID=390850 RepID=A0ACB0XPU0_MELEN